MCYEEDVEEADQMCTRAAGYLACGYELVKVPYLSLGQQALGRDWLAADPQLLMCQFLDNLALKLEPVSVRQLG
jgi:hypothetical protein